MHKLLPAVLATAFLVGCGAVWEPIDLDGDGIPFGQDCNEDDPEIGPEMAEIWYDGVDQNCDGNDADQDGDGYVSIVDVPADYDWQAFEGHLASGDCWDDPTAIPDDYAVVEGGGWEQPAAADVNPEAEDVWYDGPDQDCGGNSDFDQDGDGFDTTQYANQDGGYGLDCVDGSDLDENPLECVNPDNGEDPEEIDLWELLEELGLTPADVNPDADDDFYDGLDQNCDGADDYDFDLDGYGLCADCDDEDPERFPTGATEIWYDCVDDNCDNNDGDQDGDGFIVEDYDTICPDFDGHELLGVDDCWDDPTNRPEDMVPLNGFPSIDPEDIYPEAEDIHYDGIDADCGGDEFEFDSDEDYQDTDEYADRDGVRGSDCDDDDNQIYDGAFETCDEIDSDCDGDLNDINSALCTPYYYDGDRDDYGVDPPGCYCEPRTDNLFTSEVNTDCDDTDAGDYPGATEIVDNGDDEDCDGGDLCYVDDDGDGYGDEDGSTTTGNGDLECDDSGEADDIEDCDDSNDETYPGAAPNDSTTACMNDDDLDDYGDDSATGSVTAGTDCDDTDNGDYPGATETVDNGDDEDCDSSDLCYVDDDGDGYGDEDGSTTTGNGDLDCDDTSSGEADDTDDCDDSNDETYPGAAPNDSSSACMNDDDGDDYGDDTVSGSVEAGTDCDDSSPSDYPGATETVNDGDDEDCDGADLCYVDDDGDSYGDDSGATTTGNGDLDCDDSGEADDTDDCDDTESSDYPGASETVANGDDEDCDGVDDCYTDDDGDGYGTSAVITGDDLDCDEPSIGEADDDDDCDDTDSAVNPGETETVANGVDDDCDGNESCYNDNDNDDYGTSSTRVSSDLDCTDNKESSLSTDCDDSDADTYPGAAPLDGTACMNDDDGDDYGDDTVSGSVVAGTDCDDTDEDINTAATEITADEVDQDCDGGEICYDDSDGDGYGTSTTTTSADSDCSDSGESTVTTDCDDTDADVNPGESETTANDTDDDCDGYEACYVDSDGDDYGTSSTTTSSNTSCTDSGEAEVSGDCDDTDADVNPGETEVTANGVDDDCDGDEQCYVDSDGDDYGTTSTVASTNTSCTNSGEAENSTDCDDSDADTHPNAAPNDGTACMTDADGDDYGSETAPSGGSAGTDCDDSDADVNPDGTEVAGNSTDEDCDDSWDCYYDSDGDDDGDEDQSVVASADSSCTDSGEATTATDCDDSDATRAGANSETTSNDNDDDCDDIVDEGSYSGGEVIISEIHMDPKYTESGDEKNGEWFEIYNPSASDDLYLGGWQFDLGTGSGSRFYVGIDANLMVGSQDFVVFCYDDVTLGSKCDYVYGTDQSWESDVGSTYNGSARLANNFGSSGDTVTVTVPGDSSSSQEIDTVNYKTSSSFTAPSEANSIELDVSVYDDSDNDDGSNWCETDDTDTGNIYYDGTGTNDEYGSPQAADACL